MLNKFFYFLLFLFLISCDYLYTAEINNASSEELIIQIKVPDSTQTFKLPPYESFSLGSSRHSKYEILDSIINFKVFKNGALILDYNKTDLEKNIGIEDYNKGVYYLDIK